MTKKHFEAMAAKFRELLVNAAKHNNGAHAAGIICAVWAFCEVAAESNARFGRERFEFAAGVNQYTDWVAEHRRNGDFD